MELYSVVISHIHSSTSTNSFSNSSQAARHASLFIRLSLRALRRCEYSDDEAVVHHFIPLLTTKQGDICHVTYSAPVSASRHCTMKRNSLADFDVQIGCLAASEEFGLKWDRPELSVLRLGTSFDMYNIAWTMTRLGRTSSSDSDDDPDDDDGYSLDENSDRKPRIEYLIHADQVKLDDFDFAALLPKQLWSFYFRMMFYGGADNQWEPFDNLMKPLGLDHQWLAFHPSRSRQFYRCWRVDPVRLLSTLRKGCVPFKFFMTTQADMSDHDRYNRAFGEFVNSTLRSFLSTNPRSDKILSAFTSQFDLWTREIAARKERIARALEEAQARDVRRIALVRALHAKELNLRSDSKGCNLYISQASAMWLDKPLTLERVVQIMLDAHVLFTYTDYQNLVATGSANRREALDARRYGRFGEPVAYIDHEGLYTDDEIRNTAKLQALRGCSKTSRGAALVADLLRRMLAGDA